MIIDGKKEAEILRQEIKKEIESLKSKDNKVPVLAVILIGDFAPSQIYVKNKEKSAKEVGIHSNVVRYSKDVTEKEVLKNEKSKIENDLDYIEKIAREKYKMVKPGEKIFKVIDN